MQSFRNAVATMKARNNADKSSAEYRLSWEYWGNMHGYFGEQAKSGTVEQWRTKNNLNDPAFDPYFAGVTNTAPPDATAIENPTPLNALASTQPASNATPPPP